jgi:hypothetical protein
VGTQVPAALCPEEDARGEALGEPASPLEEADGDPAVHALTARSRIATMNAAIEKREEPVDSDND